VLAVEANRMTVSGDSGDSGDRVVTEVTVEAGRMSV
jgi:hypothetical protein